MPKGTCLLRKASSTDTYGTIDRAYFTAWGSRSFLERHMQTCYILHKPCIQVQDEKHSCIPADQESCQCRQPSLHSSPSTDHHMCAIAPLSCMAFNHNQPLSIESSKLVGCHDECSLMLALHHQLELLETRYASLAFAMLAKCLADVHDSLTAIQIKSTR